MSKPTLTEVRLGPTDVQRFWRNVEVTDTCWLWKGAPNNTGYGVFAFAETSTSAHRAAYVLTKGQIPDGLHLDHLCCVRLCVNPNHLEPVTTAENSRRVSDRLEQCAQGHPRSGDNARFYDSPSGWRKACVECKRASWRKAQAKRRAAVRSG